MGEVDTLIRWILATGDASFVLHDIPQKGWFLDIHQFRDVVEI
jgi:hypothetical protein